YRDDVGVRSGAILRLGGERQAARAKLILSDLASAVVPPAKLGHPVDVDVKARRVELARERHRKRQPNVAESNDNDAPPKLHASDAIGFCSNLDIKSDPN